MTTTRPVRNRILGLAALSAAAIIAIAMVGVVGLARDGHPRAASTGLAAAGGDRSAVTTATPTPSATPSIPPTPAATSRPAESQATPPSPAAVHFSTPEAAMQYLASAYNRQDTAALKKVTNPAARDALGAMRAEAVNLRLDHCKKQPAGDYLCTFVHDYPEGYQRRDHHDQDHPYDHVDSHGDGEGMAGFLVAPADKPGWYMTVLEYCG